MPHMSHRNVICVKKCNVISVNKLVMYKLYVLDICSILLYEGICSYICQVHICV